MSAADKRGGPEAVACCEAALAQMRRTKAFLEERFNEDKDEPDGWCPIEAASLLEQAIAMLEPLPPEELGEDRRPTREERRAAWRRVHGEEPPPGWPPLALRIVAGKDVQS
jgi:hypothetical protein